MFKGLKELQANATEQMEQIKLERVKQMELAEEMKNLLVDVRDELSACRQLLTNLVYQDSDKGEHDKS